MLRTVEKWHAAHLIYLIMFNITKIVPVLLVEKLSKNMELYVSYIQMLRASSFFGSKALDNQVIKALNSYFISSLSMDKTAESFNLSCPVRFCENALMRLKVLRRHPESAEDTGVVKIMLENYDITGNVPVREIFRRI